MRRFTVWLVCMLVSVPALGSELRITNFEHCVELVRPVEDPTTEMTRLVARDTIAVRDAAGELVSLISLSQYSKGVAMHIALPGASACIRRGDPIIASFRGSGRVRLEHEGDDNCEPSASLYFDERLDRKKGLSTLAMDSIRSLRIWTTNTFTEVELTGEQGGQLTETVLCLIAPWDAPVASAHPGDAPICYEYGFDTPPQVSRREDPVYPEEALELQVEGTVTLQVGISESGEVTEAIVYEGPAVLWDAAIEAVLEWEYEPAEVHGEPVPVMIFVQVRFKSPE